MVALGIISGVMRRFMFGDLSGTEFMPADDRRADAQAGDDEQKQEWFDGVLHGLP